MNESKPFEAPEFPGGIDALFEWISKNTIYPVEALAANIQGMVFLKFLVDKEGKVSRVEVIKSANEYLDKEAIRVINAMPTWIPGKTNGVLTDIYTQIPFKFELPDANVIAG